MNAQNNTLTSAGIPAAQPQYRVTITYQNGDVYKQLFDDIGNAAEYALAAREIGEDDGRPCETYIELAS